MSRPTRMIVNPSALVHNLKQVRSRAPQSRVLAMVKANAYGCGMSQVVPVLEGHVDAFGIACLEEALELRTLGSRTPCVVMGGVYAPEEWHIAEAIDAECVIHNPDQLAWLLAARLPTPVRVWVKVNTGMQRLGWAPEEVDGVLRVLGDCAWVQKHPCILTHFACADTPHHPANAEQLTRFAPFAHAGSPWSVSNSAAILGGVGTDADWVRPGIMLYGVSPFSGTSGIACGLRPVVRFVSGLTAVREYPAGTPTGYGHTWISDRPVRIGIVAAGYGDGYPRKIGPDTPVWAGGMEVPVVGRVSMDMLTVDLTDCPQASPGDEVELWGEHIPVERVAESAGTIGYELLCQVTDRARKASTG